MIGRKFEMWAMEVWERQRCDWKVRRGKEVRGVSKGKEKENKMKPYSSWVWRSLADVFYSYEGQSAARLAMFVVFLVTARSLDLAQ